MTDETTSDALTEEEVPEATEAEDSAQAAPEEAEPEAEGDGE